MMLPLLNFMGNKIVHVGDTGKGAAFKMLVNSLLAQSMLAFSETLLLGEKLGLPKKYTRMPSEVVLEEKILHQYISS